MASPMKGHDPSITNNSSHKPPCPCTNASGHVTMGSGGHEPPLTPSAACAALEEAAASEAERALEDRSNTAGIGTAGHGHAAGVPRAKVGKRRQEARPRSTSSWSRPTASSRPASALGSTTSTWPVLSAGVLCVSSANVRATASAISAYHAGSARGLSPASRCRRPTPILSCCQSCAARVRPLVPPEASLTNASEDTAARELAAAAAMTSATRRVSSSARERRTPSAISTARAASAV